MGINNKFNSGRTGYIQRLLYWSSVVLRKDAAKQLLKHIGGSLDSFLEMMNKKQRKLEQMIQILQALMA